MRANHFREMIENQIYVTFRAAQLIDPWQVGFFSECVESCPWDVEVNDFEWSIPEHSRARFQVEDTNAPAPPGRSMSVSIIDPRSPIE
jgi:hypothetical protein